MPIGRVIGAGGAGFGGTPTWGVFGKATALGGSGTESDPYIVMYVGDHSNFNAATVTPSITFPQAATGMMRIRAISLYVVAAAAGMKIQPYILVTNTNIDGTGNVTCPLGPTALTTHAIDMVVFKDMEDMLFSTNAGTGGTVAAQNPLRLDFVGYAATDDVYVVIEFEWWS